MTSVESSDGIPTGMEEDGFLSSQFTPLGRVMSSSSTTAGDETGALAVDGFVRKNASSTVGSVTLGLVKLEGDKKGDRCAEKGDVVPSQGFHAEGKVKHFVDDDAVKDVAEPAKEHVHLHEEDGPTEISSSHRHGAE